MDTGRVAAVQQDVLCCRCGFVILTRAVWQGFVWVAR